MKHIPRKRFGQHFLSDHAIIDAIVRAIAPVPGQAVVEIGPGLAALTQPLVEHGCAAMDSSKWSSVMCLKWTLPNWGKR